MRGYWATCEGFQEGGLRGASRGTPARALGGAGHQNNLPTGIRERQRSLFALSSLPFRVGLHVPCWPPRAPSALQTGGTSPRSTGNGPP